MSKRRVLAAVITLVGSLVIVGSAPLAAAPTETISGIVFNDRDFNRSRGVGDERLAGVRLNLIEVTIDGDGVYRDVVVATTTTNSVGYYRFSGIERSVQYRIRLADDQPRQVDQLGFNGLEMLTNLTSFHFDETGVLYGSLNRQLTATAMNHGIYRYFRFDIEVWLDLDRNGANDPADSAPSGATGHLLRNDGSSYRQALSFSTEKKASFTVAESEPEIYAIRISPFNPAGLAVAFDSDGGADGDVVLQRGFGRNWPTYQVMFAAATDFNGAIDGCTNQQPDGWVSEAVGTDPASAQVWRLYSALFGRQPDPEGFSYWQGIRRAGHPHTVVADAFAASTEFQNRYGSATDGTFARLLYANVLCREPDRAGYNYWLQQLRDNLTRGDALLYFSEGSEYLQRTNTTHPLS